MAAIDRNELYDQIIIFVPEGNVLSEDQIRAIIDYVVDNVIPENDDIYFGQAACETLKRIGLANLALFTVDGSGIKREEVGQVEIEYFDGTRKEIWDKYLDSLYNICPLFFGYQIPSTSNMMTINPGSSLVDTINPCCQTCYASPCTCSSDYEGEIYGDQDYCGPSNDGFQ